MTLSTRKPFTAGELKEKGYEQVSSPIGYYVCWTPKADKMLRPDKSWDDVFERATTFHTYATTHRFTGNVEAQRPFEDFYQPTGYIRPYYPSFHVKDEYEGVLELLDIRQKKDFHLDQLLRVESLHQNLSRQIKRQFDHIQRSNEEIVSVFKVLLFETLRMVESRPDDDVLKTAREELVGRLRSFYEVKVIGLANGNRFKEFMGGTLSIWMDLQPALIHAFETGLIHLLGERKTVIDFTCVLLGKIEALESIKEDAYLGGKLKTQAEYDYNKKIREMPDPLTIAIEYSKRGKNKGCKAPEEIAQVMRVAREFIIEKNIQNIRGHGNAIIKRCEKMAGVPQTKRSWIKFYAQKAGIEVPRHDAK